MQNSLVFNKIQKFFLYTDLLQNDDAKVHINFQYFSIVEKLIFLAILIMFIKKL